jgi:hypothetical protein
MTIVFKYTLKPLSEQTIRMPRDAALLSVQIQRDLVVVWALVDPAQPLLDMTIRLIATGESFNPEGFHYLGTTQQSNGQLVLHCFYRHQDS